MKNEYGKEIANPCPHCKGWGVRVDSSYPDYYEEYPCPKCNATGVATAKANTDQSPGESL